MSDAGSACATEPPIVPTWRTCGSPISPAVYDDDRTQLLQHLAVRDVVVPRERPDRDLVAVLLDVLQVLRSGRCPRASTAARDAGASAAAASGRRRGSSRPVCPTAPGSRRRRSPRAVLEGRRDHAAPPFASLDRSPHALGRRRLADLGDAEVRQRVHDRVDHGRRGRDRAGLADPLHAERVRRWTASRSGRARTRASRTRPGTRYCVSDPVTGCRARRTWPPRTAPRRCPERDAAVHLALDDHRVDHDAAVVDRHVAEDARSRRSRCRPRPRRRASRRAR